MKRRTQFFLQADGKASAALMVALRKSELDQLIAELNALREDKERLDAIRHGWRITWEMGSVGCPDYWFIWTRDWWQPIGEGETLRAAIDAARKGGQP